MKSSRWIIIFLFIGSRVFAQTANLAVETDLTNKAQGELQSLLERTLDKSDFVLKVKANAQTERVREVVEGESFERRAGSADLNIPSLPGFQPLPADPKKLDGTSRESFRWVERTKLAGVNASLILDQKLSDGEVNSTVKMLTEHMKMYYGNGSDVKVSRMPLRGSEPVTWTGELKRNLLPLTLIVLTVLGALLIVYVWYRLQRRLRDQQKELQKPENQNALAGTEAIETADQISGKSISVVNDRRAELLRVFLRDADAFRGFYVRLRDSAKMELAGFLNGPTWSVLLESLELSNPEGTAAIVPSNESIDRWLLEFSAFKEWQDWKSQKFFGFLTRMTNDELVALAKTEGPSNLAVIIQYLGAERAAAILEELDSSARFQVLSFVPAVRSLKRSDLLAIESAVRSRLGEVSQLAPALARRDEEFWTNLILHSNEQDELVAYLEQIDVGLSQRLAKFKFKLEDVKRLPMAQLAKVLEGLDNDTLCKSLLTVEDEVRSAVFDGMNERRREVVEGQMRAYSSLPSDELKAARQLVTAKFREVIS
jgi:hypothetical protein